MKFKEITCEYRKQFGSLLFGLCILLSGCKGSDTVWSAEAQSSDGRKVATARTIANSGFGTGYIWTAVYLGWAKDSRPPSEILQLSDDFEKPSDEISVQMKWLTPTRLELTYRGHRTLDFQAVKWYDVDISVRDLSTATDDVAPKQSMPN